MSNGDRAAVDIHLRMIKSELPLARQGLGRERFIDFKPVDLIDLQSG